VEVTAEDGAQYGISAYNEEAEELYTLTATKSTGQKMMPFEFLQMD